MCDEPCNGLVFINFKNTFRHFAAGKKQLVDHGAQSAALGKHDLRIVKGFAQGDRVAVCQGMIFGNDDDQFLFCDRNEFNQRFLVHTGTKGNVVFLVFESFQKVGSQSIRKMKVNLFIRIFV